MQIRTPFAKRMGKESVNRGKVLSRNNLIGLSVDRAVWSSDHLNYHFNRWTIAAVCIMDGNLSKQEELRNRTKRFALRIIRLFQHLPRTTEAQVLGKQLLRSGTSVGSNYRAAGRARSKAEFISKVGIVVEEADETVFWVECLIESEIVKPNCLPISSPRRVSWWPFLRPPKDREGMIGLSG
jgi:four helix bundle protein